MKTEPRPSVDQDRRAQICLDKQQGYFFVLCVEFSSENLRSQGQNNFICCWIHRINMITNKGLEPWDPVLSLG